MAATETETPRGNDPEVDLRAMLGVLSRRRWVGIGVFAACVAIAILLTARAPRVYQAQAVLLIEEHAPKVLGQVAADVYDLGAASYWATQEYYETQYAVIRSRPVAERVVASLGLTPALLAEQLRASSGAQGDARDSLDGVAPELRDKLEWLGFSDGVSRTEIQEALKDADPVAAIQRAIVVDPVKDSRLVRVKIENTSPERAARLANAVAGAYIQLNLDQKVDVTRTAVDWLSDQTRDLKTRLEESELGLHEFKKSNQMFETSLEDRQSMTTQRLSQLNEALSRTKAERLGLESRIRQIRKAEGENNPDAIAEINQAALVQEIKTTAVKLRQEETELALRYTAEHPKLIIVRKRLEVVAQDLANEIRKVIQSVEKQLAAVTETESLLEEAIATIKSEALDLAKREIEYNRLERERTNNKALYELVLKRQKEADLSQMLRANNIRQLEMAQPPDLPIRPRVPMNLALGLLIGLILGIAAAFVVDYLDSTIKTQEQVEQLLNLAFLGMVPSMKGDKGAAILEMSQRDRYIIANPRSSVAECCRTIRTNILFMSTDRPAKALLITSSGPREGKSTTVVNLGITMAQSGARTVIVDTDMRRPRLHKSFEVSNDIGISGVIVGEMELDQAIRASGEPRLDILTCGPIPPNPAELLHTDRFKRILEELCRRYDRVIFDSPPVSAVSDALVLASMTDGVVLVVQAGQTSQQAAMQAKKRLAGVGARFFGVVLNDLDLDNRTYGSYYQYYYYRAGYGDEGKPDAAKA